MNFSKKIITGVIIANVLFSVAVLGLFLKTQKEPVTLIGTWFGFTTVEVWNLASIKKTKIKGDSCNGNDIDNSN